MRLNGGKTAGLLALSTVLLCPSTLRAYSVMTHQAMVDSAWIEGIQPLLKRRFPSASSENLRQARAYSYGGSIIQDLGYYPFGSKFFTNLVHYVRTADFIKALIDNSRDINEYAFALGALAHYASDNSGHPLGVNPSVPLLYPKLGAKYGKSVTYAASPSAHLKTEFGFDVLQVARGNYTPDSYRDFIGFKVSKEVLQRAFEEVYCIPLKDLFLSLDLSIGTYRRTVSKILPEATKVAWELKRKDIEKFYPGITSDKFIYRLARRDYEREWGAEYEKPGPASKVLSVLMRIVPRVGFFKALSFKMPNAETEKLFVESFQASAKNYLQYLKQLQGGEFQLEDRDFDTGRLVKAGEYRLCDETYAELLDKLTAKNRIISAALRSNITGFYGNLDAPIAGKENRKAWRKVLENLESLKSASAQ